MSNPLAELSILLHLKISKWDGEVSDQRALAAVATAFKGSTAGDKYRKSLFVNAPLKSVDKAAGRIRTNFYKWTLAWQDGGGRLVPSMDFRDFAREHATLVADFDFEVNEFCASYDDHKRRAESAKGDLYDEANYPSVDDIRERFSVSLQTLPFPSTADFRVEAPEEIIEDLKENMNATINSVTDQVASTLQGRLKDRLQTFHDALASEKRFTKSIFEEMEFVVNMARSLKTVIPGWLQTALSEIEDEILAFDAEQTRNSESLKEKLIVRSGEILVLL